MPFCNADSRVDYFEDDNNKISMHEFPKDENIKEAWIQAISRQGMFVSLLLFYLTLIMYLND